MKIFLNPPLCFQQKADANPSRNPEGIESFSPGLRGTSYPGLSFGISPTLKGLNQDNDATLSGLEKILTRFPRVASLRIGNPGLNDSIPSELGSLIGFNQMELIFLFQQIRNRKSAIRN